MSSRLLAAALVSLLLAGGSATAGEGLSPPVALGDFSIAYDAEPFRLEIRAAGYDAPVLAAKPGLPFLEAARGSVTVKQQFGAYHFKQDLEGRAVAWQVTSSRRTPDGGLELELGLQHAPPLAGGVPGRATLRVTAGEEGTLHVLARVEAEGFNRLVFNAAVPDDEDYLGFGEQYNRFRHAGMQVPVWVSEQGIGRTDGSIRFPFTGSTTDSYFPIPYFLSTRGYGFLADTTARSVFDLKTPPRADRLRLEIWDSSGGFRLFLGPRPADVVRRLTRVTGRPRMLPEWGFGCWVAVQGGPGRIRELLANLDGAGAEVDAVWAQDWLGARKRPFGYDVRYHWTWDPGLYPDLPGLIAELHERDVRFMGYFNTFIEAEYPEFAEAREKGFLVRTAEGQPYIQRISIFDGGLLDLSNPAAREYMAGYLRQAIALGMDGWMADFGEWLPWDSRIHAPEGPELWHNRYPVEWARLNRETFLSERPDGDFVVFNRSGFTGSTRWSDIIWAGDQNTSWSAGDGFPSVLPAGLNLGLSGVPFYHFDAGGFTSLVSLPRRSQLFMRWVEAAAMSPLLRTHEGYWRQLNAQVDSSGKVLDHFARMTRLHRAIQPKIVAAAREAAESGIPLMRHMWLAYPDDPATLEIGDQYLLGPDLLAAPVLAPDRKTRRVYFPADTAWRHWSSGKVYHGPGWAEVPAPVGTPALFHRAQ